VTGEDVACSADTVTARFVKICGVTRIEDAVFAAEEGADAIGVNLVPTSKRFVQEGVARRIAEAVGPRAMVIAVVADLSLREMRNIRKSTGIDWLQLHGSESESTLSEILPHAFKAVPIGDAKDVEHANGFSGDRLLVDAKVAGQLGGTGATFDWSLVRGLAVARRLILAGGLTPDNVADALRAVDAWGVDVASGVEGAPGVKDRGRVRAFIQAVRSLERP
jgi:phosphoribosylanthranilate isomerase